MKKVLVLLFLAILLNLPTKSLAQTHRVEQLEGQIQSVEQTSETNELNQTQRIEKIKVQVTEGRLTHELIEIKNIEGNQPRSFSVGDNVIVGVNKNLEGTESYFITDHVRRPN